MTNDELERLASHVRGTLERCECPNGGVWAEVSSTGYPSIEFCTHHTIKTPPAGWRDMPVVRRTDATHNKHDGVET